MNKTLFELLRNHFFDIKATQAEFFDNEKTIVFRIPEENGLVCGDFASLSEIDYNESHYFNSFYYVKISSVYYPPVDRNKSQDIICTGSVFMKYSSNYISDPCSILDMANSEYERLRMKGEI